jgi:peptidoglycan/xylan/chitin deacetylase (PgdA/CDA1 family)
LEAIEWTLQRAGIGALYVRARHIRGAVILMYHSVAHAPQAAWIHPRNRVPPGQFEAHARFLSRHRHVVSMSELVTSLELGVTPAPGTVAITFDDGYLDNLTVAAPILRNYGLSATLYLSTANLERGDPQSIDRVYGAFRARTRHSLKLDGHGAACFDLENSRGRCGAYRHIAAHLLTADVSARERMLALVEQQLEPEARPPRLTMTWDDVRALRGQHPSVEIGVHTRHHMDLSQLPLPHVREELEGCIMDVEQELGIRPQHFAFPYNRSSEHARRLLADFGFRSAVGSGSDALIGATADRLVLPRIEAPHSNTMLQFVTSGAYPGLPRALVGRA